MRVSTNSLLLHDFMEELEGYKEMTTKDDQWADVIYCPLIHSYA